jgi:hypothetical protein
MVGLLFFLCSVRRQVLIIIFPPDVIMVDGCYRIGRGGKRLSVEAFLQNGFYMFIGTGIQRKRSIAGGFETFLRVMFGQSHDPQTGAKTLFRMTPTFENPGDQRFGKWAVFAGPGDYSGRSPFQIFLVGPGHMFR